MKQGAIAAHSAGDTQAGGGDGVIFRGHRLQGSGNEGEEAVRCLVLSKELKAAGTGDCHRANESKWGEAC